jgi:hypothetical protein
VRMGAWLCNRELVPRTRPGRTPRSRGLVAADPGAQR